MSSPTKTTPAPPTAPSSTSSSGALNNVPRFAGQNDDRDRDNKLTSHHHLPMPGLSGNPNGAVGNLLRGAVDSKGDLKDAALQVGIKLDLEAEVHLTARVRGDIIVGLY
ncbi:hypothetical protein INS49_011948 [Diaporthe citri]|uniref:uncharacterized protein n=1 Tax=Diaporthe citri TaxID=83186 RepID=UPI001C7F2520|nr:uncharacterized protein INS49_011948 [Diaporthe citri]KAG6360881.1 hypothetical protein INS49_011948 [Diaporthe citri]